MTDLESILAPIRERHFRSEIYPRHCECGHLYDECDAIKLLRLSGWIGHRVWCAKRRVIFPEKSQPSPPDCTCGLDDELRKIGEGE